MRGENWIIVCNFAGANPVLATPVYLAGYIEHLGTGTLDMIAKCKEKGLRTPTFELDEDVVITLWRKDIYQKENVAQNVAQSRNSDRLAEVLTLISTMKHISQSEIAERLGVNRRTINCDLDILRQSIQNRVDRFFQNGLLGGRETLNI